MFTLQDSDDSIFLYDPVGTMTPRPRCIFSRFPSLSVVTIIMCSTAFLRMPAACARSPRRPGVPHRRTDRLRWSLWSRPWSWWLRHFGWRCGRFRAEFLGGSFPILQVRRVRRTVRLEWLLLLCLHFRIFHTQQHSPALHSCQFYTVIYTVTSWNYHQILLRVTSDHSSLSTWAHDRIRSLKHLGLRTHDRTAFWLLHPFSAVPSYKHRQPYAEAKRRIQTRSN